MAWGWSSSCWFPCCLGTHSSSPPQQPASSVPWCSSCRFRQLARASRKGWEGRLMTGYWASQGKGCLRLAGRCSIFEIGKERGANWCYRPTGGRGGRGREWAYMCFRKEWSQELSKRLCFWWAGRDSSFSSASNVKSIIFLNMGSLHFCSFCPIFHPGSKQTWLKHFSSIRLS